MYNYAKNGNIEKYAEQAASYAAAAENPDLIDVEVEAAKVVKKEFTIQNNQRNKSENGADYSNVEGKEKNSSDWSLVSNSNANASSTSPPILFHCPQPSEQGALIIIIR